MASMSYQSLVLRELKNPPSLELETHPCPTVPTAGTAIVRILSSSLLSYAKALYSGTIGYPLSLPMVPGGGAIVRLTGPLPPDATSLQEGDLCFFDPTVRGRDEPSHVILLGIHGGATEGSKRLMRGTWRNGTMAELASVPLENLFPLNEKLLCGNGMGYSYDDLVYIQRQLVAMGGVSAVGVNAGDRAVIAPATGGFGGAAVEVAIALGADVIMVGRNRETLARIRDVLVTKYSGQGKIDIVALTGELEKDVANITAFGSVDEYLDFSPPQATKSGHIMACLMALKRGGVACFEGGITGAVEVPYGLMLVNDLTIKGKWMYEREEVKKLIKLLEGGRLLVGKKGGIETVGAYNLKDWEKAIDAAEREAGWGKQVVVNPNPH